MHFINNWLWLIGTASLEYIIIVYRTWVTTHGDQHVMSFTRPDLSQIYQTLAQFWVCYLYTGQSGIKSNCIAREKQNWDRSASQSFIFNIRSVTRRLGGAALKFEKKQFISINIGQCLSRFRWIIVGYFTMEIHPDNQLVKTKNFQKYPVVQQGSFIFMPSSEWIFRVIFDWVSKVIRIA